MASKSISKQRCTTEEGVLLMMQQPGVLDAVLKILESSSQRKQDKKSLPVADEGVDARRSPQPGATEATEPGLAHADGGEYEAMPVGYVEPTKIHPCKLPSLEEMQAAGYQGSAAAMRTVWQWAKDHVNSGTYCVWPTPVAGMQEALRFDAWGWPHQTTTCEEWINMITYWTAMREQMISGASRSQRAAVENAFAGFSDRRGGRSRG